MSKNIIEPRILKGFRDTLPQMAITRTEMIRTIQESFSSFGFVPIDTPALEYAEILLGKGSDETDKQMYRFLDNGERDVALRFDLTIPLARFVAMYINELGTPFKRYHIAPVWRAEKPQRGRYREFFQCDVDIVGSKSPLADAEILQVLHKTLSALKIAHTMRINNRGLLNGLLTHLGLENKTAAVLRAIDKLEKLGQETVRTELKTEAGLSDEGINDVFSFLAITKENPSYAVALSSLKSFFNANDLGIKAVNTLETIIETIVASGMSDQDFRLDLSIARGLDYYTGTVFETTLNDLPHFGSISSGGRYDNLASLYTKRELPGVGGSIGLDRILGAYEELGRLSKRNSTASVLLTLIDHADIPYVSGVAQALRDQGHNVEISLESGKLGNQFKYAEKKGIDIVVIAGEKERSNNTVNVKKLSNSQQLDGVAISDLSGKIREMLS